MRSTGLVSIGKGIDQVDLLSNVPVKFTARGVRCEDERDPVKDFIRTLQFRCINKPAHFRMVFPMHGGVSDNILSVADFHVRISVWSLDNKFTRPRSLTSRHKGRIPSRNGLHCSKEDVTACTAVAALVAHGRPCVAST